MDAQEVEAKIDLINLYRANKIPLNNLVLALMPKDVDEVTDEQEPAHEAMMDLDLFYAMEAAANAPPSAKTFALIQNVKNELEQLLKSSDSKHMTNDYHYGDLEKVTRKRKWNLFGIISLSFELSVFAFIFIFGSKSYTGANGEAVEIPALSTTLGIENEVTLSILCVFILGLIFGHIGLRKRFKPLRGKGFALAGLAVGYFYLGLLLFAIILAFGLYALSMLLKR